LYPVGHKTLTQSINHYLRIAAR